MIVGRSRELLHLGCHFVNGNRFQWDTVHFPSGEARFPRKENQVTPSRGACATSSADTMNVDVGGGGDADLDDSRHSWVINTSSRDITGHQDRCSSVLGSECVRSSGALVLGLLGMELVESGFMALRESGPGSLPKEGGEELRHFGGGEENDGLGEFRVGELVVGK